VVPSHKAAAPANPGSGRHEGRELAEAEEENPEDERVMPAFR
jgi:hypothetical protein